ncbi:YolD-like family protein [Peribacillus saganii]|uniref:YolD-like family protein n=1 Tax=Peribacillus saganii TaxID=2303992 RepID=A0A372LV56_9BACI|nr:YolD-like family protein [Peribacillus saganii]RFU71454.1 YolD-like family protein [Peribacillus saganii]
MSIRDRGKLKWQSAFFMPEHVSLLRAMKTDYHRIDKPVLDEYQIEELEQKICLAMEFTYQIKIQVWNAGFIKEYKGFIHRLDELSKRIFLELDDESMKKIYFSEIIGIEVVEA